MSKIEEMRKRQAEIEERIFEGRMRERSDALKKVKALCSCFAQG